MSRNPNVKVIRDINYKTYQKAIETQVKKMIDEGKYCIDVLNQIKAAKAALVRIESNVLKKHVESCVVESFKNKKALDSKVEELLKLINK